MEEARRFLRYVVPGLVFSIEISLYLMISDYPLFKGLIEKLLLGEKGQGIGVAISGFLASGGIGFLLSIFYHFLSRFCTFSSKLLLVDFREALMSFDRKGWLKLRSLKNDRKVKPTTINQLGAWRVITSLWNERIKSSSIIKGADGRTARIVDIVHALGAAFIGSFIAIVVWLAIHWQFSKPLQGACLQFIGALVISLLILFASYCNFRRTLDDLQGVVIMILANALREHFLKKGTAFIYVTTNDLTIEKNKLTIRKVIHIIFHR